MGLLSAPLGCLKTAGLQWRCYPSQREFPKPADLVPNRLQSLPETPTGPGVRDADPG